MSKELKYYKSQRWICEIDEMTEGSSGRFLVNVKQKGHICCFECISQNVLFHREEDLNLHFPSQQHSH